MPQCRFCLEDADEDQLIAPCNCDGSHKFVHQECLAEWRRGRFPGARRRCNVCNAKWTTKPPPRAEREFFARAVKTAPRYRPAARDVAHAAALRALLQSAGGLIAQAPRRAEAEAEALQGDDAILTWATDANAAAARAREAAEAPAPAPAPSVEDAAAGWAAEAGRAVDARRPSYEAPPQPQPQQPQRQSSLVARFRAALGAPAHQQPRRVADALPGPPSMASLMVAVLRARAQRHWHRGVFLILYVGKGAATDGSDAIVACGVTRRCRLVGGEALEDGEVDEEAAPSRRRAWLRSAVAAVAPPASSSEDESDSDRESNEPPADVRAARKAVERLRRMGCRVAVFSGGPVHRSEPLGLLVATRSDGARDVLDDDALRAKVGDVVPWRPGVDGGDESRRAFVGAVPLVARCARFFREAGWALEALVWSGCAVWSTDQLLAEVSRGSWALAPARWSDASAAADSRGLWGDVLAREAALLPPDSADED